MLVKLTPHKGVFGMTANSRLIEGRLFASRFSKSLGLLEGHNCGGIRRFYVDKNVVPKERAV